jgi:hypothetical protein
MKLPFAQTLKAVLKSRRKPARPTSAQNDPLMIKEVCGVSTGTHGVGVGSSEPAPPPFSTVFP